jgi:apolipoprotein N-acyltransferase
MGSYLAVYQVLFVGLARVAVHRWKLSVVIAAPAVWTGLELVRGYLITGFSMALLGHTQVKATSLIQIADLFGAYGVSFLVVFVGACVARSIPQRDRPRSIWPLATSLGVVACVFGYGRAQIAVHNDATNVASLKVALIQGTEDTILDSDVEAARKRAIDTFNQYWRLTLDVRAKHDDIDLIIWPEGVFSGDVPQLVATSRVDPPPGSDLTPADIDEIIAQRTGLFDQKTQGIANAVNRSTTDDASDKRRTYLLVGCDAVELSGDDQQNFNAALLIDPGGEVAGRYDKMHRVMIGEYVPFGDQFPWLYDLSPIGRGLTAGTQPASFDVHGINISPSICFEDTVPHLMRRQVREFAERGDRPDVLVNLTNDGWFWGSGILDLQLSCAVFRAIELRRPLLVAANTGLTASIDSNGTVRDTLRRRREGVVVTDVTIRRRTSVYERWGDVFAGLCLVVFLALTISGCRDRWKAKHTAPG